MGIETRKPMLVSVIIPAFNSANTIERTLDSVFNQDYPSIEIIVVNDGSTDDTELVLKKYFDKIKYYFQKNSGVSTARNLGLQKSEGDYIQYLDADDLLAEGKISTQVEALINTKSDVAYGDWVKFTELSKEIKELEYIKREMKRRPEIEFITDFWVPLAALLYSRKITEIIGSWNTSLPVIQDARYSLDAAILQAKFIYTPGVMGYYRVHETGSLSTNNKLSFINDCFENAKQIDAIWRKDYSKDFEKKNAIISVLRYCIGRYSKIDKLAFNRTLDFLFTIDSNYIPDNPKSMKILSSILGYRNTENLFRFKRKFK